ncbi:GPI inositol deacylase, partial [Rhizopus stolonifer]
MLGFTVLGSPPKYLWLKLGLLISATLVILLIILDSFLLHRPELLSIVSRLQRQDVQNCVMSYAYPMFFEINQPKPNSALSQKYKLYLYREGHLDDPNKFYGVPALFIPGQAGSHKQIRSLASATTHWFHSSKSKRNIDYFTVDLNEELSAMSGQVLLDQAEYINKAIERILLLYKDYPEPPTSVLIIAHSMGGIVARTMFTLPSYIPSSINTIITLATPHLIAPLLLDSTVYRVYRDLAQYWQNNQETLLENVTLVSIAGGSLDNIVHSDGTNIEPFVPETHGFATYTTSIPGVWTGADHMAILWCNQLIRLLASTLLQVVETSSPVEQRMAIFQYNLLQGGEYSTIQQHQGTFLFSSFKQKQIEEKGFKLLFDSNSPESIHLLPLSVSKQPMFLTNIQAQYDTCWSFIACSSQDQELVCKHMTPRVTVLPSAAATNLVGSTPYRLLTVDQQDINTYDYVGIVRNCSGLPFGKDEKAAFIQAYFKPNQTKTHWNNLFQPMMKQIANQHEIKYYRGLDEGVSDRITFHQSFYANSSGIVLEFFSDQQPMTVQIRFDWYGTLGRCVLHYGVLLVHFLVIINSILVCSQMYSYIKKQRFVPYPIALVQSLSGPFLHLAGIILVVCFLQLVVLNYTNTWPTCKLHDLMLKYVLIGSNEWVMVGFVVFLFGLSIGLAAIVWLVGSTITLVFSRLFRIFPAIRIKVDSEKQCLLHIAIILSLSRVVPLCVLITGYMILWLFKTSLARLSAESGKASDLDVYYYSQS